MALSKMTLDEACEQFLRYQRDVRQLSPHTLAAYGSDLQKFTVFCQQRHLHSVESVRDVDVRHWVAALHKAGSSGKTLQRGLSSLRALFRFLGDQNPSLGNPAADVRAPKTERRLPKSIDPDNIGVLFQSHDNDPLQVRDHAIAELLYSSGLRLSELVAANIGDIDQGTRLITVTGKGRKTRTVPIGQFALQAVQQWLALRPLSEGTLSPQSPLFISQRGRRLSARSVQDRLKQLAVRSGLSGNLHPHMLRHSFASHLLQSSGDLRAVQELLGHANISTTQVYTHLDYQHLAQVYDAAHPRAQRQQESDD